MNEDNSLHFQELCLFCLILAQGDASLLTNVWPYSDRLSQLSEKEGTPFSAETLGQACSTCGSWNHPMWAETSNLWQSSQPPLDACCSIE